MLQIQDSPVKPDPETTLEWASLESGASPKFIKCQEGGVRRDTPRRDRIADT